MLSPSPPQKTVNLAHETIVLMMQLTRALQLLRNITTAVVIYVAHFITIAIYNTTCWKSTNAASR